MCGIFGYVGERTDAAKIVFEGLKKLEYRGYDSWGIAVKSTDLKSGVVKITLEKKEGKLPQSLGSNILNIKSNIALGHTRWATHGSVNELNAHPHLACDGSIAAVHNGIIENYLQIKEELIKKGHKFKSVTDTEVAVHLVEENLKKYDFKEAVRRTYLKLQGLNALIFLSTTGEIIAAKKGSPLVVGMLDSGSIIASDPSALVTHTKRAIFLEDDQMVVVGKKGIYLYNAGSNKKMKLKIEQIKWNETNVKLGKFKHFMLKEIYEQVKVLKTIASNGDQVKKLAQVTRKAKGVFLIGCGSASYASMAGVYLFSKIAKKHINFSTGSEFSYLEEYLNKDTLVIALSQSGETIDVVLPTTRAKAKGAQVVGVTNVLGSTLYRLGDNKVLLDAGPELAVCATKSYCAMVATLISLTWAISGSAQKGKKVIVKTATAVKGVLKVQSVKKIIDLARRIKDVEDIYVIGRGISYPAALEAALKLKEVSYIHSEGFAGGELKHGVIALIHRGTPCIVFAPQDETYSDIISNAIELKSRGAYIIGISSKKNEVFDYFLKVDDCGEGSVIAQTIPVQLLTYFIALERGLDPDKPRNLAKSVTVK